MLFYPLVNIDPSDRFCVEYANAVTRYPFTNINVMKREMKMMSMTVLKCALAVYRLKAKCLGWQSLCIQFQSITALKILCVTSRFVRYGRPFDCCEGLEVVMLKYSFE